MKVFVAMVLGVSFLAASVDINSASVEELSSLKGVGHSKAQAIVDHRERNCFKSVEELSHVKGIGSKTVEKNRENLSAGACKK
jgi:competence protein ComEA